MNNVDSILEQLSQIPIGTIIAWVMAICVIITAISVIVIKLYKVFDKTRKIKEDNDSFKLLVESHTEQLNHFETMLKEIKNTLDEQKEVNLKQLRHEIVNSCESALKENKITTSSLCSLEEMYEEYTDIFHANGYVKVLMEKVRKLEIVKNFDE